MSTKAVDITATLPYCHTANATYCMKHTDGHTDTESFQQYITNITFVLVTHTHTHTHISGEV